MQPLSLVLAQAIRKMNIAKPFAMHSLIGHWRQLVGDDIADHSQPQKVEFGVLVVMVDSSVWTHHLTLLKTDILQKIHQYTGEKLISDLRFKAGILRSETNNNTVEMEEAPPRRYWYQARWNEEEAGQIGRLAAAANDEDVRGASLKLLKKIRLSRRWKEEHGWQACASCGRLRPPGEKECSICAFEARRDKRQNIRELLTGAPWLLYGQLRQYIECTSYEYTSVKADILAGLLRDLQEQRLDDLRLSTLVMLTTGLQPEALTEELKMSTVEKFRRKKYVSSSRV
ncbi:MAG: DUF721 domain-containing protein [Anaeromusa sp.]|jgi:predicted nucleic acid-binding Zn ribbon protein|uniref:DUF721 domain-containing protein n=1 Tax=Anaeromusa sp. TaxID=1872520 RepID=UPI002B2007AE|nr:DUF721 domain-containing protein [Anaeromusa sp.]MEA4835890.1 DUF721 domain-containing protein [Anaeromusa sp.]